MLRVTYWVRPCPPPSWTSAGGSGRCWGSCHSCWQSCSTSWTPGHTGHTPHSHDSEHLQRDSQTCINVSQIFTQTAINSCWPPIGFIAQLSWTGQGLSPILSTMANWLEIFEINKLNVNQAVIWWSIIRVSQQWKRSRVVLCLSAPKSAIFEAVYLYFLWFECPSYISDVIWRQKLRNKGFKPEPFSPQHCVQLSRRSFYDKQRTIFYILTGRKY